MRNIKYIVVHCTATSQTTNITSIQKYWREKLGWKSPGYHLIILPNGHYQRLAEDSQVCNGVAGYNSSSIHVSYIGGIDSSGKAIDNRTEEQKKTLTTLLRTLKSLYPNAIIQGHRDFPKVAKDCPCFNAKKEYSSI